MTDQTCSIFPLTHVVVDELLQIRPVLSVQAADIVPVEGGEGGFGHGDHSD
jgi:hypothetical protein